MEFKEKSHVFPPLKLPIKEIDQENKLSSERISSRKKLIDSKSNDLSLISSHGKEHFFSEIKRKKDIFQSTIHLTQDLINSFPKVTNESILRTEGFKSFSEFSLDNLHSSSLINFMKNSEQYLLNYFHFYFNNAEFFFKPKFTLCFEGEMNPASLSISPNCEFLAIGGSDKDIKIIDLETKDEKTTYINPSGGVPSVKFSKNGKAIASAGLDGTGRLWFLDEKSKTLVMEHVKDVEDLIIWNEEFLSISENLIYYWNFDTFESNIEVGTEDLVIFLIIRISFYKN